MSEIAQVAIRPHEWHAAAELQMNVSYGPYSASVDQVFVAGIGHSQYHIVLSRYGTPLYEQIEVDFEEAIRVANAYIEWELAHQTDA